MAQTGPPSSTQPSSHATLDAASRERLTNTIGVTLLKYYVNSDVAKKMNQFLQDHQKRGDYSSLTDRDAFAEALQRDLVAVSHDSHLHLNYDPSWSDHALARDSDPEFIRFRSRLERSNCTFSKIEILPHNIGYLKFNEFAPPDLCGPTVNASMNFLAHTDALIIDLRENGGGSAAMVQLIASYFFDQPTHLNDQYVRHENKTDQYWTLPYIPGPHLKVPLYVLTAHRTFSAAEEFSYDLQTQKRAMIVGEVTSGGSHPGRPLPVGEHFILGVPYARMINPVTHTDWEGTGVQPDVKASAAQALETAQKLAIEKLGPQ